MHLTGFMVHCPAPHTLMSWIYPREKTRHYWYEPEYWQTIARTLERGKFDMFFFADQLAYLHKEGGGDGFQFSPAYYGPDCFEEIVDLLIPVLQKRGLFRKEYEGRILREHLQQY